MIREPSVEDQRRPGSIRVRKGRVQRGNAEAAWERGQSACTEAGAWVGRRRPGGEEWRSKYRHGESADEGEGREALQKLHIEE
jgi:hypothetical protein